MSPLLELRNVTVRYGHVTAVENISFSIGAGDSMALLGPNGAGKTTILRAIGRLLRFNGGQVVSGDVLLDGNVLRKETPADLVTAGVSQVLEGRRIFTDLSVRENLRLGAYAPRARSEANEQYDRMMTLFPRLKQREQSKGGLLSGGEQQMLAIARALMSRPRLLLLDEPSLGLAPIVIKEIGELLQQIRAAGTAILLVDQTVTLPSTVTTTASLLEAGRIRRQGPTHDLLADSVVLESYLGIQSTAGEASP